MTGSYSSSTQPLFYIGQRISLHHSRGTIRFIGSLQLAPSASTAAGPSGNWLGIEWDDARRGKHWGDYNGIQYFTCLYHERDEQASAVASTSATKADAGSSSGPASFVRPTASGLIQGISVIHALQEKYLVTASDGFPASSQHEPYIRVHYSRKNLAEIEIEVPDLDKVARKVSQMDKLKSVGLQGRSVGQRADAAAAAGQRETESKEEEALLICKCFDPDLGHEKGTLASLCPSE